MIWAALVLAFAAAFIMAGIEGALLAVSRVRARHAADEGDRLAGKLVTLLELRSDLLQAAVAVNHACAIAAFALLVAGLRPVLGEWDLAAAVVVALPLFLIGLELLPKSFFRRYPFRTLRRLTLPLSALRVIAVPWRTINRLVRRADATPSARRIGGVAALADNIAALRLLPDTAASLLCSFAAFEGRTADDFMTPLSAISALPADLPLSAALPVLEQTENCHRPVLDEHGVVIGYFDAVRVSQHVPPDRLVRLVTQPLLRIKTVDPAFRCLQILRKASAPMALVVNGEERAVGVLYVERMLDALLAAG